MVKRLFEGIGLWRRSRARERDAAMHFVHDVIGARRAYKNRQRTGEHSCN
jgi:hypothetical protein